MIKQKQQLLLLLISLVVGLVVTALPWENWSLVGFEDKGVYQQRAEYDDFEQGDAQTDNPTSYLLNEVLWEFAIKALAQNYNISSESVLLSITFFCWVVFSYVICNFANPLYLVFLINPLIIDLTFSQIRSAFAIAFVALALLSINANRNKSAAMLLISAAFIHSICLIIYIISIAIWLQLKHFSSTKLIYYFFACVGVALLLSFALGPLRYVIFSSIGDRRADYQTGATSVGYMSFWIFLLLYSALHSIYLSASKNQILHMCFSVTMVSLFIFLSAWDVPANRFLALSLPSTIILISIFSINSRFFIILPYFIYTYFQWLYWLGLRLLF